MTQSALHHSPISIEDVIVCLQISDADNSEFKLMLKAMKVTGAMNARYPTKPRVVSVKLVQLQLCVKTVMDVAYDLDIEDCGGPATIEQTDCHKMVRALPKTSVKITKATTGVKESMKWASGDVPQFREDGAVVCGSHAGTRANADEVSRQPDFTSNDYVRLIHVMVDSRMTAARDLMHKVYSKAQLEQPVDPWTKFIEPLFNDPAFCPNKISDLYGGICESDIAALDPKPLGASREGGFLKAKWTDFRKLYEKAVSDYNKSGNNDPDSFVNFARGMNYVMYGYCVFQRHPGMEECVRRGICPEGERESGIDGEYGAPHLKHKKRRLNEFVTSVRMPELEKFAESLREPESSRILREEPMREERDRLRSENLALKGTAVQSLLQSISAVETRVRDPQNTPEQKESCDRVLLGMYTDL